MLVKIHQNWVPWRHRRRKRALNKIRYQFKLCGYGLEHVTDLELEAAITRDGERVKNAIHLTAKRLYWTLRRLSHDGRQLRSLRTELSGTRACKR